jgi:hypothetical protein
MPSEFLSSATTACTPCQNKGARSSSGCCALLSRVKARGPTITCYRENRRPKCLKVSSGKFKQKENQKQCSPPLAFPCRRGHLSGVASAATTSVLVSSRGRIIRPKVSFESGKDSADGAPLVQPIAEGPRAQSEQTRLHARTRCSSRTKSDAAPTPGVALADPASDPASERAAIAPQLRADMLHLRKILTCTRDRAGSGSGSRRKRAASAAQTASSRTLPPSCFAWSRVVKRALSSAPSV